MPNTPKERPAIKPPVPALLLRFNTCELVTAHEERRFSVFMSGHFSTPFRPHTRVSLSLPVAGAQHVFNFVFGKLE